MLKVMIVVFVLISPKPIYKKKKQFFYPLNERKQVSFFLRKSNMLLIERSIFNYLKINFRNLWEK